MLNRTRNTFVERKRMASGQAKELTNELKKLGHTVVRFDVGLYTRRTNTQTSGGINLFVETICAELKRRIDTTRLTITWPSRSVVFIYYSGSLPNTRRNERTKTNNNIRNINIFGFPAFFASANYIG